MGYILLIKENGQASYINKIFDSPEQCFEFCNLHNISRENYEIVEQSEFESYLQSQQRQQNGSYKQIISLDIIDEEEPQPKPMKQIFTWYRPHFVSPSFVGKKIRR